MKRSVFLFLALFAAGCDCASAKVGSAQAAACGIEGPTFCGKNWSAAPCAAAAAPGTQAFGGDAGAIIIAPDGGCSIEPDAGACSSCVQSACCSQAAACPTDADAGDCAILDACARESCADECPEVP